MSACSFLIERVSLARQVLAVLMGEVVTVRSKYTSKAINVALVAGWFIPLALELHQLDWLSFSGPGIPEAIFALVWFLVSALAAALLPDWAKILRDIRNIGVATYYKVVDVEKKASPKSQRPTGIPFETRVKSPRDT